MKLKVRMFFFEKKNQKTFAPLVRDGVTSCGLDLQKFFCFFFFKKRSACFDGGAP
jgi:hypothetical protein